MRRVKALNPNIDQFAEMLRSAVGDSTVAINWDYAREVLQKANGVIATVALAADDPDSSAPKPATASQSGASPGRAEATPSAAPEPVSAPNSAAPPQPAARHHRGTGAHGRQVARVNLERWNPQP